MSSKTRNILIALTACVIVTGAVLYCTRSRMAASMRAQSKILTLEDAKAIKIDTASWGTYGSGFLQMRYPEGVSEVYNLGVYDSATNWGSMSGPKAFLLGATQAVQLSGTYLPSEMHQRLLQENGGHDYGSRITATVLVFDKRIPSRKIIDSALREMAPNELSEVSIDGKAYTLTARDEGANLVQDYIRTTESGRTLYVRFVLPGPFAAKPPVQDLAQRTADQILSFIMIP